MEEVFAALSHLANRVSMADKYRPESCCIVGNYYSLKGQHEMVCLFSFLCSQRCERDWMSESKKERNNAQPGNSMGDPACLRAEPKEALQGTSLCDRVRKGVAC